MTKMFATFAVAAAIGCVASLSPASASDRAPGVTTAAAAASAVVTEDQSARRRRYRVARQYKAPAYGGYYGPVYYDRPYARPAAPMWGWGGWW